MKTEPKFTTFIHFFRQTGASSAVSLRKVAPEGIQHYGTVDITEKRNYESHEIDLSIYQIYSDIQVKYYKDNYFVYTCIQSGVFTSSFHVA